MKTCIALFRGINVGGHNKLPMSDLVNILEHLDLWDIRTYIQSGNVVFQSKATSASQLSTKISNAIKKRHGFSPRVLLLDRSELQRAMAANPFPEAESEPKTLHLYFISTAPEQPDIKALEQIKGKRERFQLCGRVFYLHTPDGFGKSKLATRVEHALGVEVTARNWRTVCKIMELAAELEQ